MIDLEFIERCNFICKDLPDESREKQRLRVSNWNNNNRDRLHEMQRKYRSTEKGKQAAKKRNALRARRHRELVNLLSDEEKIEVQLFYMNCPLGYEVDHIIPISKGGRHHVENLQYLTPEENRSKGNK
jgi:5-methylcytosine-specific restriction endonuclease McrA